MKLLIQSAMIFTGSRHAHDDRARSSASALPIASNKGGFSLR